MCRVENFGHLAKVTDSSKTTEARTAALRVMRLLSSDYITTLLQPHLGQFGLL